MKNGSSLARRISDKLKKEIDYLRGAAARPRFPDYFDERRAIFIHIPKAAGMSVTMTLFGREVGHWRVRDLQALDREKTRTYFKFTFTRNPWDRLVSAYFFLGKGGMAHHPSDDAFRREVVDRHADFTDFVKRWLTPRNARNQIHFVPQHEFVCDRRGQVIVDYLGKYERLAQDFGEIARRLRMSCELPHHNPGRHEHYTECYTDETREIVRRVYRNDIELFGYGFGD